MKQLLKQCRIDTEASVLLGISQKHNMCSSPYRLTEFCNSQCLSHFAAPFIIARTETSIVENCKLFLTTAFEYFNINFVWMTAVVGMNKYVFHFVQPITHWYLQELQRLSPSRFHIKIEMNCSNYVRMILPQVHLRKPCYDFPFL